MRCPKCQYISFDAADRCRNCGYEFSLSTESASIDLPIQTGDEPLGPFADFSLTDLNAAEPAVPASARAQRGAGLDLPLFTDRTPDDDRPLVASPAVPRAPLAVRRSSPVIAHVARHARVEEPELDLGLPELSEPVLSEPDLPEPDEPDSADAPPVAVREPAEATAPLGRRFGALIIDGVLLGLVDVGILYFTLRLCDLQFAEVGLIPPVPFLAFLLLQNGGYFVAFVTVGGQTLGKMAAGIKVVPAEADARGDHVSLGTSVVRAALWFLTVLPAGIGLLPALFGSDHRAVHDRLAGTRVVKA